MSNDASWPLIVGGFVAVAAAGVGVYFLIRKYQQGEFQAGTGKDLTSAIPCTAPNLPAGCNVPYQTPPQGLTLCTAPGLPDGCNVPFVAPSPGVVPCTAPNLPEGCNVAYIPPAPPAPPTPSTPETPGHVNVVETLTPLRTTLTEAMVTPVVAQRFLKRLGLDLGTSGLLHDGIDGIVGTLNTSKTKIALMTLQRRFGLVPDGILGPRTRALIANMINTSPTEPESLLRPLGQ